GTELDTERDEVGKDHGDRDRQAVEMDLAQQIGIRDERARRLAQGSREVIPRHDADHIEKERWRPVRRKAGYLAENHVVRQRGEERLEEMPSGPEHRLLVLCDEVSLDEEADQIAAAPQLTKTPVEPPAACGNHREVVRFTALDHFARATS